jgi:NADH:ubiquinone oxidoreductase subunit K
VQVGLTHYLVVSAVLFCLGLALVMAAYRNLETVHVDQINVLKW